MSTDNAIETFLKEKMNLCPEEPNLSERGAYDAYLNVLNFIKSLPASQFTQPKDDDTEAFLKVVAEERDSLVIFIRSFEWRTDLKTHIEDLLIMYDQMAERLKNNCRGTFTEEDIKNARIKAFCAARSKTGTSEEDLDYTFETPNDYIQSLKQQ